MEEIELTKGKAVWNQVDKLEQEISEKYEKKLNELLAGRLLRYEGYGPPIQTKR
jgi:hypothetical protein